MARTPSQKEIAAFVIGHGIVDFISGGKLQKIERDALWKVLKKLGPATARATVSTIPRLAGTVVGGARLIAMRHPYITAAVVTYEVVKNREQIAQLLGEGWEVIGDMGTAMAPEWERFKTEGPRPITGVLLPGARTPKRRKTAYNRAVSAGMKALKRSNKMGKKGKFTNSKRAFALVSKTASRLNKGVKVAMGPTPIGIAARAMKAILRRRKKK